MYLLPIWKISRFEGRASLDAVVDYLYRISYIPNQNLIPIFKEKRCNAYRSKNHYKLYRFIGGFPGLRIKTTFEVFKQEYHQ